MRRCDALCLDVGERKQEQEGGRGWLGELEEPSGGDWISFTFPGERRGTVRNTQLS